MAYSLFTHTQMEQKERAPLGAGVGREWRGGGRAPHGPGCCTGQLEATWSTGSISAAAGPAAPGAAGATVPQLVSFVAAQAGGCRGREPPPWAMATEPCSEPLATSAFCSRVAHKQGHYEATTGYWPLGLGH
jgi:hypothetical protein